VSRLQRREAGIAIVGVPGTVAGAIGITLFDAVDGALVPIALVAVTVNVYAVPKLKPPTIPDVALALALPVIFRKGYDRDAVMGEDIKRSTARRKAALVLEIIQG
jgi:hypothetical protein